MSRIIEITAAEMALASAQSNALRCLESYEARPLASTRRALNGHRELMLNLGCDDVANQIIESLWFKGNG
jgi:hypothetical protein